MKLLVAQNTTKLRPHTHTRTSTIQTTHYEGTRPSLGLTERF
jgi:hypothetical protein